jgi:crotonobetainyl-CoA:carnitine CoA-transferase CaiB-like acyl-CoA transferase
VLRMPAFGLAGPWRDRPGYAQTMEQVSGMAWATGFPDGPPTLPNGQCDPIGGNLAVIALLLALEQRRLVGHGMVVECPLVLGALNIAAEQVVHHSATGELLGRTGNRSRWAAPEGVYACRPDSERSRWVAVSVTSDPAWLALVEALGRPPWSCDRRLRSLSARRGAHDQIDAGLAGWCATRRAGEVVELLWAAGVPAAEVLMPHEQWGVEQLQARNYFEELTHPLTGTSPHATFPARFSTLGPPWLCRPAPLFGEHDEEILSDVLGFSPQEIAELRREGVVGARPRVGSA